MSDEEILHGTRGVSCSKMRGIMKKCNKFLFSLNKGYLNQVFAKPIHPRLRYFDWLKLVPLLGYSRLRHPTQREILDLSVI